jgi:hypothetical protein
VHRLRQGQLREGGMGSTYSVVLLDMAMMGDTSFPQTRPDTHPLVKSNLTPSAGRYTH